MLYQKIFPYKIEYFLSQFEEYNKKEKDKRVEIIPRDVAQFLYQQIRLRQPKVILEIGTGHGYSTIWLALAAKDVGARVYTVEISPDIKEQATKNLQAADILNYVTCVVGDAKVAWNFAAPKPIDFIFVDTTHADYYPGYVDNLFSCLSLNGIMYFYGVTSDKKLLTSSGFFDRVKTISTALSITIPIGDGLESILKIISK